VHGGRNSGGTFNALAITLASTLLEDFGAFCPLQRGYQINYLDDQELIGLTSAMVAVAILSRSCVCSSSPRLLACSHLRD